MIYRSYLGSDYIRKNTFIRTFSRAFSFPSLNKLIEDLIAWTIEEVGCSDFGFIRVLFYT